MNEPREKSSVTESPNWTLATLDQYMMRVMDERDRSYQQQFHAQEKAIDAAFHAQEKAVAAALSAAERAVNKAEVASEKRFDSVNEFRSTLTDQNATFLPRPEFDRAILALYDKLDASNKTLSDKIESNTKMIGDKLDVVRAYKDIASGHSAGLNSGWVYLLGLIAVIGTLITIVMAIKK